jgi:hypothetical protein
MAKPMFETVQNGILGLDIRHRYPLTGASQAHLDLETDRRSVR